MRTLPRRLRDRTEAVLGQGLIEFLVRLPKPLAPGVAAAVGRAIWMFDKRRKRVALDNLAQSVGEEFSEEQRREIAERYYQNLARSFVESAIISREHPNPPVEERVHFEHLDEIRATIAEHGPTLFLGCHAGSWELMSAGGGRLFGPVSIVVRPISNPILYRRVVKFRSKLGMETIPSNQHAASGMMRALRRGRSLGILVDLNHRHNPVFVNFFGRPAATVRAPGVIAARMKAPVIAVFCRRTGPFQFQVSSDPPILPRADLSEEENAVRFMVEVTGAMERRIRSCMDQWAWNYRRWKTPPSEGQRIHVPEDIGAAAVASRV